VGEHAPHPVAEIEHPDLEAVVAKAPEEADPRAVGRHIHVLVRGARVVEARPQNDTRPIEAGRRLPQVVAHHGDTPLGHREGRDLRADGRPLGGAGPREVEPGQVPLVQRRGRQAAQAASFHVHDPDPRVGVPAPAEKREPVAVGGPPDHRRPAAAEPGRECRHRHTARESALAEPVRSDDEQLCAVTTFAVAQERNRSAVGRPDGPAVREVHAGFAREIVGDAHHVYGPVVGNEDLVDAPPVVSRVGNPLLIRRPRRIVHDRAPGREPAQPPLLRDPGALVRAPADRDREAFAVRCPRDSTARGRLVWGRPGGDRERQPGTRQNPTPGGHVGENTLDSRSYRRPGRSGRPGRRSRGSVRPRTSSGFGDPDERVQVDPRLDFLALEQVDEASVAMLPVARDGPGRTPGSCAAACQRRPAVP
jgi:hypothetical protein